MLQAMLKFAEQHTNRQSGKQTDKWTDLKHYAPAHLFYGHIDGQTVFHLLQIWKKQNDNEGNRNNDNTDYKLTRHTQHRHLEVNTFSLNVFVLKHNKTQRKCENYEKKV